jgi:hypothetical protein
MSQIKRIGTPGLEGGEEGKGAFPYRFTSPGEVGDTIVYAPSMTDALALFKEENNGREPWKIRWMSDNE